MVDFFYEGFLDEHDVAGRVADGRITGNPFVAIRVRRLVANEVHVGLGAWAGPATLDDDILARATVAAVVDEVRFRPPVMLGSGLEPGVPS
jgi:hypothetical protein